MQSRLLMRRCFGAVLRIMKLKTIEEECTLYTYYCGEISLLCDTPVVIRHYWRYPFAY